MRAEIFIFIVFNVLAAESLFALTDSPLLCMAPSISAAAEKESFYSGKKNPTTGEKYQFSIGPAKKAFPEIDSRNTENFLRKTFATQKEFDQFYPFAKTREKPKEEEREFYKRFTGFILNGTSIGKNFPTLHQLSVLKDTHTKKYAGFIGAEVGVKKRRRKYSPDPTSNDQSIPEPVVPNGTPYLEIRLMFSIHPDSRGKGAIKGAVYEFLQLNKEWIAGSKLPYRIIIEPVASHEVTGIISESMGFRKHGYFEKFGIGKHVYVLDSLDDLIQPNQ